MLAVMGAFSQMTLAWALDQVVDLNNGLDTSQPLDFTEELLCLAAIFTWSGVVLAISLAINMLFKREKSLEKEENLPAFMRVSFTVLSLFTCLNLVVRTQSETLKVQNAVIVPLVCLSFTLICLKRVLLMELRKHRLLSGYTLNLG